MKRSILFTAVFITTLVITVSSCGSKRNPGRIYMPDMAYSRAYETYALRDSGVFTTDLADLGHKIFYNNMPVAGTIKRGESFPYTVPNDSNGLLVLSAQVKNPLAPMTLEENVEAARLFNVNCAICHGAKGENNGPLAPKIGGVKSIIATSASYSDGRLFHVISYGQKNMGSYASQLSREQRWRIVQYIRTIETKTGAPVVAAKADSAVVKK